jgi:predicted lipid-binding transport protein (Tim44 family)
MRRASLLFKGLVIVAFVAALGANGARAQTSQPRDSPTYGQQPQSDDQSTTSQKSDDSGEDNPGARPDQGDSSGSADSDQNNNESNDSDSSEQENHEQENHEQENQ